MLRICLWLFFILATASATAQKSKAVKAKLTEHTIVKDTAGNVLPAGIWQQLARNSNYTLYPVDASLEQSDFVIRQLSESEKAAQLDKMPRPQETKAFKTGKPFGAFNDKDLAGNTYNDKDLKGKVVVINFWFINCPPCRMEIPELNALVEKYKEKSDVVFLAVALDGKYELQQFLQMMPFNYNIIANGQYMARKFGVSAFPTHVVVDREGLVAFHTAGLARNTVHWVQKSIEKALSQPAAASVVTSH